MDHRQRFMAVLEGKQADCVPVLANLTPQLAERLAEQMHKPLQLVDSFLSTRISHLDILLALGNDAVEVAATRAADHPTVTLEDGRQRDEWGIVYEQVGLYAEAVVRPLAEAESVEDVEAYPFPDAHAAGRWDFAEQTIAQYKDGYGLVGDMEACLFELAWNLTGLEKFLMDLLTEEEYVDVLLDKILEYSTQCGLKMIDLGVDMLWTGDDFGTQSAMMVSPDVWRRHFKPRMAKMFAAFKERNPQVKIAYHSCGAIAPIIPDLIEIGLDFLNPIQPKAEGMDLAALAREYGDALGFFGGVDVQGILPNGTTEDVANEVKRCLNATKGRRFIIAPAHNIQPDTPVENVFAFYEAVKKYGTTE